MIEVGLLGVERQVVGVHPEDVGEERAVGAAGHRTPYEVAEAEVQPNRYAALAEPLHRCVKEVDELARSVGEAGRSLVEDRYNWPRLTQEFADYLSIKMITAR